MRSDGPRRLTAAVLLASAIFLLVPVGCASGQRAPTSGARYTVIATYPHDSTAYTQGLLWSDGQLIESTGRLRLSDLRRVDLTSGRVLARRDLPAERFGEGLALLDGWLYQLTWQGEVAYVYDARSLERLDSIPYAGEGWGLATDGQGLYMSDGSDSITVRSAEGLRVRRVIHVRHEGEPVAFLNELEYSPSDGMLLANVHRTNRIARIDPATGAVEELLDLNDLYPEDARAPGALTMNGIAVMPDGDLLLTGKLWPVLFRIRLSPPRP